MLLWWIILTLCNKPILTSILAFVALCMGCELFCFGALVNTLCKFGETRWSSSNKISIHMRQPNLDKVIILFCKDILRQEASWILLWHVEFGWAVVDFEVYTFLSINVYCSWYDNAFVCFSHAIFLCQSFNHLSAEFLIDISAQRGPADTCNIFFFDCLPFFISEAIYCRLLSLVYFSGLVPQYFVRVCAERTEFFIQLQQVVSMLLDLCCNCLCTGAVWYFLLCFNAVSHLHLILLLWRKSADNRLLFVFVVFSFYICSCWQDFAIIEMAVVLTNNVFDGSRTWGGRSQVKSSSFSF